MKTKRIIPILMVLTALVSTSCYKLDPVDYSEINPSIFPQTEEDLAAMVLSCYHPLRGSWWNGINSTSERGQMYLLDACTEVLTGNYSIQQVCGNMSWNRDDSDITWFYYTREDPYGYHNKVSRATLVLDAIENSNINQDLKNRYEAEVRCARAYLSYILYDMFGPLVVAPLEVLKQPLVEAPLPRLSQEEMVKFIEDDLIFAQQYLPAPNEAAYGRFSKGMADMLLVRLYLHEVGGYQEDASRLEYYNKVEEVCRRCIDYGYYRLEPSYTSLFEKKGQTAANREYIFVVPCNYAGESENQWHMMVMPADVKNQVQGWGTCQSTWFFYDSFEPNDVRKTYLIPEYLSTDGTVYTRENPASEMLTLGPILQKYEMDLGAMSNGGLTDLDIVVYRYADILLSMTEALVMKPGGAITTESLSYMNTVRARAGLEPKTPADFPTQADFITHILNERGHEYWCESGQYRADMIRHDRLYDRVKELYPGDLSYKAAKYRYLFPLPQSVITDGKGQVQQNPGYIDE